MTEQELKDDISLKSDNKIEDIDLTSAWDSKKNQNSSSRSNIQTVDGL